MFPVTNVSAHKVKKTFQNPSHDDLGYMHFIYLHYGQIEKRTQTNCPFPDNCNQLTSLNVEGVEKQQNGLRLPRSSKKNIASSSVAFINMKAMAKCILRCGQKQLSTADGKTSTLSTRLHK